MSGPASKSRSVPLPGGIRPGESLWSVVNRLVWLHRPGIDELIEVFEVRRTIWPDLLVAGNSYSTRAAAKSRFLIPLVGMSERQLEAALLPLYLESQGRLVYCPTCAGIGYHSIVLQLPGVTHCPSHGERLLSRCKSCSAPISTKLGPEMVTHPYGCTRCGTSLISSRVDFFRGERPSEVARFTHITRWLQQLTHQVLAWGDLHLAYHSRVATREATERGAQLLALAESCHQRTPPSLQRLREVEQRRASFYFPFSAQPTPVTPKAKMVAERPVFTGAQESVRIYRVYLKSLRRRYFSTAFLKAMHRSDFALWSVSTLRRFPVEVAVAYAILLLRLRCEGWPNFDPLRKDPGRYLLYNHVRSRDQKRGYTLILPRSSHDRQDDGVRVDLEGVSGPLRAWVIAHWQLMEYARLFAEALLFASEQLKHGRFDFAPHLEGRLIPDLFVLVRDEAAGAYRLDFWEPGQMDKSVYREEAQAAEAKEAYYSRLVEGLR